MVDKFISSLHIQKLGHKISEIRERALLNIISKLDNGVLFDNDLARSKELLTKLFQWFLLEPCTMEEVVFSLLKRILKSESGKTLVNHCGKSALKRELNQIRSYIEPQYYPHLDELSRLVDLLEDQSVVPPLESEVPLSYRTNESNTNQILMPSVESTATTIEGYIQKEPSVEHQMGVENLSAYLKQHSLNDDVAIYKLGTGNAMSNKNNNSIPNYLLKWQPLVESDRHVLQSIENSLRNPLQPSALLHSCEFFINVLLHDFPAEIFLQRPTILLEFYSLVTCGSTRITNAVLNCLCDLTRALHVRINHYNDASMQSLKTDVISAPITPTSSRISENDDITSNATEKFEKAEDVEVLQRSQLPTPKYCFMSVGTIFKYLCDKHGTFDESKVKTKQVGINLSLKLLDELLDLLRLTLKKSVWNQQQNETTLKVLRDFNEMLVQYGEALEYFRLESITTETKLTYRVIYIYLVHQSVNLLKTFVPLSKTGLILPRNLKNALSNSSLDVTLGRLYPEVHNIILDYVQSYSVGGEMDPLKKYKDVTKVCQGMAATVRFLKEHASLGVTESFNLAKIALPSLDFHEDLDFLRAFVDMCSSKLSLVSEDSKLLNTAEEIILSLLAHNLMEVRKETYRLCQKKVVVNIGPKLNMSNTNSEGVQILFLLTSKILVEIAAFGMTSENIEICRYAEDIITYILKCKILVGASVWNRVIEALIPSLPIIACHVTKNSTLGKTVITFTDPDTASTSGVPSIVMVKCNIQFLFGNDAYLRDEAFSRICWLLASQENSREMLPKFNTLYDTSLANVCHLTRVVDINKVRCTEHFYQPSSLHQVMELLNSQNVEPVLRRSALNQVSVMVEDPLLHQIFLESNGIYLVTEIMKTALTEGNYRDYPDSVVPIVSILKNICLYHSNIREQLSINVEIFYCILRGKITTADGEILGLFLFFTEERMKQDATTLLFLLIFKDFARGSPSTASFSLPELICEKMHCPFLCNSHWKGSDYTAENLKASIVRDRWCLSSIQIQWNTEIFGGFHELIKWDKVNYDDNSMISFVDDLKLSDRDLKAIKSSSLDFCIQKYLNTIQNGTSHGAVIEALHCLTLYVYLYKIASSFSTKIEIDRFLSYPWEQSFSRFVRSLPSCEEDVLLLKNVIEFFTVLVPFYKNSEKDYWIATILRDSGQCILDLISVENTMDEEKKIVGQELLRLITVCVCQEQHYLDYYTPYFVRSSKPWTHILKIVADNLTFSDTQHFYNLAYLDALLSSLVHLTATLGWSDGKPTSTSKGPIPRLISVLRELIDAFHCGKGPSATVSVMGLSITRHVLLILNHLLAELQHSNVKGWEEYFLEYMATGNLLRSFLALWASRDVILRAAALQLFSGLAVSPRASMEIVNEVIADNNNIWELAITIVCDHTEASIVRENAAQLLANLVAHVSPLCSDKLPSPNAPAVLKQDYAVQILKLFEEHDFYSHLDIILSNLFTIDMSDNIRKDCRLDGNRTMLKGTLDIDKSWDFSSGNSDNGSVVTTPSFIKCIAAFLLNMINLAPENISDKLMERGLIKLLFRTLCNPSMSVSNTKELSLYIDILEMDTAICSLLARLASCNLTCLGTILHTKDCLNVMLSLLNYKIYQDHLPQLVYLRNRLWTEIFLLIAVLTTYADVKGEFSSRSVEVLSIFSGTLLDLGKEPFLETLNESIICLGSKELQNSALLSLTALLRIETYRTFERIKSTDDSVFESCSLQTLLDSVRTPRSVMISTVKNNIENTMAVKNNRKIHSNHTLKNLDKYKMSLLEETYFGQVFPNLREREIPEDFEVSFVENNGEALMAGAELCKILLYLYDIYDLKTDNKKRTSVVAALTGLLCISKEAKKYALQKGLAQTVIQQLKGYHIRLSLESVECLRRIADKRRVCPILKEVNDLVGLLINFMVNDETVKNELTSLNLADVIHKLWVWFLAQNIHLADVLRMVCTYTTGCILACQSLTLTSSVAGSGPRKTSSSVSLLHTIISLVAKEMDQVSKKHNLRALELSVNILCNCCESLECRILMAKSNLFQNISRLHPALTKKQKLWESIELIWLEFLQTFTTYPEGQASVTKNADMLELTMSLTSSTSSRNRLVALLVLRNLSFYQPNKPRLLSSGVFLNILGTKLTNGSKEEKTTSVVIIWALAANSQKAKIILKSAHLDSKLQNMIKHCQVSTSVESKLTTEEVEQMYYVLQVLRDGENIRR